MRGVLARLGSRRNPLTPSPAAAISVTASSTRASTSTGLSTRPRSFADLLPGEAEVFDGQLVAAGDKLIIGAGANLAALLSGVHHGSAQGFLARLLATLDALIQGAGNDARVGLLGVSDLTRLMDLLAR